MKFSKPIFFAAILLLLLISCSAPQDTPPQNPEETAPVTTEAAGDTELSGLEALSRFAGTWVTPETYRVLENARIRLSLNEAELRVSGPLQYVRLDPAQQPVTDTGRLFLSAALSGSSAAQTLSAEIRNERGDVLGEARLALRDTQLHVQLLNPVPDLAAIFVLEREE